MLSSDSKAELTPRQLKAIQALLTENSMELAAKACGVSTATLGRWKREFYFSTAFKSARADLFETAMTKLQGATGEAVDVLLGVMRDELSRPGERASAARTILEFAVRSKEMIELEGRLTALENTIHPPEQLKGVA